MYIFVYTSGLGVHGPHIETLPAEGISYIFQMPAQTRTSQVISERNRRNARNPHHNTPQKARLKSAIKYRDLGHSFNGRLSNAAIFEAEGFSERAGRRALANTSVSERTFPYKDLKDWKETRGHPGSVSAADIKRIEDTLEASDIEQRSMTGGLV